MIKKTPQSIEGRFYINSNCINCSLCSAIAENIFATNHHDGYEYIKKQPQNEQEVELVGEVIQLCPANAIRDNG